MSAGEVSSAQSAEATTSEVSLLDQAIAATRQTERSRTEELLRTLTEEAMKGTVTFSRNMTRTLNDAVNAIDAVISKQLAAVMHAPEFQKLEGSWRGLQHLVMNSETGAQLKIRVFNISKKDLLKDLEKAVEFDQSQTFKKLYENEFGTPGGEPYGTIIGDYEFSNHPDDIELLSKMSNVAAASFAPFISSAGAGMFGIQNWGELPRIRDLEKVFDSSEYAKWKSFRESDDSRFVTLTMPRVLSRLPYGAATKPIEEFAYEEFEAAPDGRAKAPNSEEFCYMNAAYVLGTKMTASYASTGFCVAIRGAEGGGKVEGLPAYTFVSDDGDPDMQCPTEVGITDRREAELSKLGFLPLCHYKNTDYAVFFGAQTTQKPKKYDSPDATANAAISARLPYIMATSRFAHFLKVMARDKIGSFMEASDCSKWLNRWINNYVNNDPDAGPELKAKFPLRAAKVEVKEIPGAPGSYNAVAYLQPWLQMEELTTSMRLVAKIPQKS
jgi:type VI secretion system protein ImpC